MGRVDATAAPTITVLGEGGTSYDVFEVVTWTDRTIRVRAPLLFEIGEELTLRIVRGGEISESRGRVARHAREGAEVITAIDLFDERPVRRVVSG